MSKIASLFVNLNFFDFKTALDCKDLFYKLFEQFNDLAKNALNNVSENDLLSVKVNKTKDNLFGKDKADKNEAFFYHDKMDIKWENKCKTFHEKINTFFKYDEFTSICNGKSYYVKIPVKAKGKNSKQFRLLCVLLECENIKLTTNNNDNINNLLNSSNLSQALSYYLFPIEYGVIH